MIPALSIRQPWAWLILNAGKDIENRDWPTNFRGRVLIHASKTCTKREYETAQHVWAQYPASIAALGNRLAGVMIENRPAIEVLAAHDSQHTLFYVDPPYMHETRCRVSMGTDRGYRHEMADTDHAELLQALCELDGMVILSGYPNELYDSLLHGWRREDKRARISGGRGTAIRTECIWINPACQRARPAVQLAMDLARA